ncbi:MAG: Na+/H+ antiporter NhaC family protein, partial [Rikenellaceae bacterium]
MSNVFITPDNPMSGANQLSLLLAAFIAGVFAMYNGVKWDAILKGISHAINTSVLAILILLMVGMLSGAWMSGGIIPTMIYYGLDILRPEYFLVATVVITAIVSVATGSSWSTIATVGVALIAIGEALGFSPAWSAGAIISGAYFGDKVSPLSDTTNLAATAAQVDIFRHIRFMMRTTVPSILVSLVIFTIMGVKGVNSVDISSSMNLFQENIDD